LQRFLQVWGFLFVRLQLCEQSEAELASRTIPRSEWPEYPKGHHGATIGGVGLVTPFDWIIPRSKVNRILKQIR
jgi:hypothetical protein